MKVMLTGSRGFIGSYFIKKYRAEMEIVPVSFQHASLYDLNFEQIDIVIHLGALVHQMDGAEDKEYYAINTLRTIELALKAKADGVRQFVFMSSVKVYGEESDIPYNENSICDPQDSYGRSKLEAENALLDLQDGTFTVSIIRTPIVYGFGVKGNIKSLIKMIQAVPIIPLKKSDNSRSMVYIGNLCSMLETIIRLRSSGIHLASDDHPLSTTEFVEKIISASNKRCYVIYVPFFKTFLSLWNPSIYRRLFKNLTVDNHITRERLNFKNPYDIDEGIHYMINGE